MFRPHTLYIRIRMVRWALTKLSEKRKLEPLEQSMFDGKYETYEIKNR